MKHIINFTPSNINRIISRLHELGYEDYSTSFDPLEQTTVYFMTNSRKGNKYTGSAVDVREDGKACFYAMNGRRDVVHPITK